MKNVFKLTLAVIAISFICSSCGVMFGGSRYNGNIIVKNHPKAQIFVNGQQVGVGSSVGMYKRDKPLIVEVREEGCQPATQYFDNTFRGGNFFLSLITWGLVGVMVDLGTGACYKPDHAHNPNIIKTTEKNFVFNVEYTGCPANTVTEITN
jgi:hypothetical protein